MFAIYSFKVFKLVDESGRQEKSQLLKYLREITQKGKACANKIGQYFSTNFNVTFWLIVYETFFHTQLNSTEHEISTAHKTKKSSNNKTFLAFKLSDVVFIMLINVKMPTIVGILTFMSI